MISIHFGMFQTQKTSNYWVHCWLFFFWSSFSSLAKMKDEFRQCQFVLGHNTALCRHTCFAKREMVMFDLRQWIPEETFDLQIRSSGLVRLWTQEWLHCSGLWALSFPVPGATLQRFTLKKVECRRWGNLEKGMSTESMLRSDLGRAFAVLIWPTQQFTLALPRLLYCSESEHLC